MDSLLTLKNTSQIGELNVNHFVSFVPLRLKAPTFGFCGQHKSFIK
ncbi:hypothetical protein CRENPOLYSF2_270010 [Crenothrix polyspora]|uniref:Uncharacterized protein n=1 Tax=Crenothrix polyspora TaxID=360316 RepID=A0A1R4H8N3_9GAMM|nr:hypothetical protein CRENPOLYSF2_270010 [Crenothrix polyspora]